MAILQLDITENRPDGQAANERGELTDWQRKRLVNQLEYPYQPHTRSFTVAATIALTIAVSLAIFTGMMWSSLRYPRQWHYRFIQAMAFGVLICFGIGCSDLFRDWLLGNLRCVMEAASLSHTGTPALAGCQSQAGECGLSDRTLARACPLCDLSARRVSDGWYRVC